MTAALVFLALLMACLVGWLLSQSINVRPWAASVAGGYHPQERHLLGRPNAMVGLLVLMAVITSLFALCISAYLMRMHFGDWRPLPEPRMLWINSGCLVFGSIALQLSFRSAGRDDAVLVRRWLAAGGLGLALFIVGQTLVWRQLGDAGYYAASNPANAFFYVITGLHVVHLLGGVVAWSRTTTRAWSTDRVVTIRTSIGLCALYAHFLLAVWVVIFVLLLGT